MLDEEDPQNQTNDGSGREFWIYFVLLFAAVFVFQGKAVPFSNEFVYLLRLVPDFLPHDWTFSRPANEHWFFNFLFGVPARLFSIEILGWLGRIAVWSLCLIALLKIGRRGWRIPWWAIAGSIFVWLAFGQAVVAEEWIFGGFEAKTLAYVCLLFALESFSRKKTILPSALLGLTFSFHPAIGFWAIPAVGLALLAEKPKLADYAKIVFTTAIFALPGIMPLLFEQSNTAAASIDDWRFIVEVRAPANLDPFQFSRSGMFLVYAMLAFNFFALAKSENFALRLLLKFQIALGVFFLLGVVLRWFELYSLLRLMPTRLFPVFTPLFFLFTAYYVFPKYKTKSRRTLSAVFVLLVVALLNPFGKGWAQLRETKQTWTAPRDDFQRSCLWLAANAPPEAIVIQTPARRDVWYFSKRATVVSYAYPTYDRLPEWRARLADLTGNLQIAKGETAAEEIDAAFERLNESEIENLERKYDARFLVSRAIYSFPVVFESGGYRIYRLGER